MIANAIQQVIMTTTSPVGNSAEIDTIAKELDRLTVSVDSWNRWMIVGLIVTAIAAVWVVIATRLVVLKSKQVSAKQIELDAAKDRQLQSDLREKDLQLEKVRGESKEKTDALELKAREAEVSIEAAKTAAATANERAAEANRLTEQERLARVQLEAQIAPRRLTTGEINSLALELSMYRGRRVTVISYAMDAEAAVLAKQIVAALRAAELNVNDSTSSQVVLGGFSFAVHVNGSDFKLVNALRIGLTNIGHLTLADASLDDKQDLLHGQQSNGAAILVGVKPVQP